MKISQREARRLKRRVLELANIEDARRNAWAADYPGGVHLGRITRPTDWLTGSIYASRKLRHAVVVTLSNDMTEINFYALPLARKEKEPS